MTKNQINNKKETTLPEIYELNGKLTNSYIGDFDRDEKDDLLREKNLPEIYQLNDSLTNSYIGDLNADGEDDFLSQEKEYNTTNIANILDLRLFVEVLDVTNLSINQNQITRGLNSEDIIHQNNDFFPDLRTERGTYKLEHSLRNNPHARDEFETSIGGRITNF